MENQRTAAASVGPAIARAVDVIAHTLSYGGKVLTCGNGGSAAMAQYFAVTMLDRGEWDRPGLPAIALTADASTLTAITADYTCDQIFARQIRVLGQGGDVLLVVTTSGKPTNLVTAVHAAKERGMLTVALSGRDGGEIAGLLEEQDVEIRLPGTTMASIQEVQLLVMHCLCDLIDHRVGGTLG